MLTGHLIVLLATMSATQSCGFVLRLGNGEAVGELLLSCVFACPETKMVKWTGKDPWEDLKFAGCGAVHLVMPVR